MAVLAMDLEAICALGGDGSAIYAGTVTYRLGMELMPRISALLLSTAPPPRSWSIARIRACASAAARLGTPTSIRRMLSKGSGLAANKGAYLFTDPGSCASP
ncbi:hypothetical protein TgHK011_006748 [Trichoderma gracile]|nr:hypothetical protein TgHK011_006748 [Trichoderma gracile]